MRLLKIFFALALTTTLAGTAWSQSANLGSSPEVLGYLNPVTNSFRPMSIQAPIVNPAAVSVATGTIVTNFMITVKSAIASTVPITCNVAANVTDIGAGGSNIVLEQAAVVATRGTGTAKCTVTIPYSWNLFNRSTDRVQLTYQISTYNPSTAAGTLAARTTSQYIANIAVPATGATTTETVIATM